MRRARAFAKGRPHQSSLKVDDLSQIELATYAERASQTKGRRFFEPPSRTRTAFARDRDRIIHATAFRRLKEKTQVFVAHEGDHYRTRLTHSLEVAQIGAVPGHALRLDDDLAETIALAHDLGHPPFAHAGEDELVVQMAGYGGFDHNVQSFRVVTALENRYPQFDGLNPELGDGRGGHQAQRPGVAPAGGAGLVGGAALCGRGRGGLGFAAGHLRLAGAQCAAIADDIAYNNHDVDDGVQAGLFTLADLAGVPLIGPMLAEARRDWPEIDERMLRIEAVRRMIGVMVEDVLAETQARLRRTGSSRPRTCARPNGRWWISRPGCTPIWRS